MRSVVPFRVVDHCREYMVFEKAVPIVGARVDMSSTIEHCMSRLQADVK